MEQNISKTIQVGLSTLSDPELKVSSSDIEILADFKSILRAVLNGQLVIASPDKIVPDIPKSKED